MKILNKFYLKPEQGTKYFYTYKYILKHTQK